MLRRIVFPLRLALRRLRGGGERVALVSVGAIAGAAVIAAVLGGSLVMQDRALQHATSQLQPDERVTSVAWFGGYGGTFPALDKFVAPRMANALGTKPVAAMLFREASIQGRLVNLRAANDLDRYVTLTSGRLPKVCVPTHCEVLRLAGVGPVPSTKYLRLIQVGSAKLKPDTPFAWFVLPAPQTQQVARAVNYHTPQPSPVLIANGVNGLSHTKELETFGRVYTWNVLDDQVHPWDVGAYAKSIDQLTATIDAQSDQFQVTAPTTQLQTAADGAKSASHRLLLLGGEGGALLLAFTVLAAAALRRDVADARRRLVWFGARRWQVELHTLTESVALAGVATVAGWIAGGVAAAVVARSAGVPAGAVVTHALLSGTGIAAAVVIAAVAGALLYLIVRAPAMQVGSLALTPLDVAALGAIAVVVIGWARGSIDASQLQGASGTNAFLLVIPALIVFAAAVIAARLLAPALRGLGVISRRAPIALRLAAASLARNPGRAAIAATFLVASLGLALFAVAYRATLVRGQHDEASYAVPASFVFDEDLTQLIPVLHGAKQSDYPHPPEQVLRLAGNVTTGAPFTLLGLPGSAVRTVGGWRASFASASRDTLAAELAAKRDESLRTLALPGGRQFSLPVSVKGDDVGIQAWFRGPLGDYQPVTLGRTNGAKTVVLHARIPFPHGTLARFEFYLPNNLHGSANGGIGIQPSAKGVITFGTPRVNGKPIANAFDTWTGIGGVSGGTDRVGYLITPDRTGVYRPKQPTDATPLPILATPAVAAEANARGILPLQIEGDQITAHIVGIVNRFPSANGDVVIADRQTASTLLDTESPGLGLTDELWLNVRDEAATAAKLAQPPFTQMTVQSRAATLAQLQSDPLALGALITLAGTAIVALVLALLGLLLSAVGEVRDERGDLFDLEAQGASPATMRAQLRLRALLVALFGIAGGIGLGAILSSLVISLVDVTATAAEPQPPLALVLDWPVLAIAAAVYVVAAALLVGFATRLRGRAPQRAAEVAT
ncbi:MAG TPA: FtsX-like permease family protein [Gaiellaceae bacterium]|nr:FtsX-like permease family protein [Gaiellaceae bacterium]